jgi:hypothetical protein
MTKEKSESKPAEGFGYATEQQMDEDVELRYAASLRVFSTVKTDALQAMDTLALYRLFAKAWDAADDIDIRLANGDTVCQRMEDVTACVAAAFYAHFLGEDVNPRSVVGGVLAKMCCGFVALTQVAPAARLLSDPDGFDIAMGSFNFKWLQVSLRPAKKEVKHVQA